MLQSFNVTRPSISESGMRIMRLLIGHPPQTIIQLIDALKITRTAVTEQLRELLSSGYVEQMVEHSGGRGRPRYLFTATILAMQQLFEGNQGIVVPAIWRSLKKNFGDESLDTVYHDVADEIAQQFLDQITSRSPRGRIREFVNILSCCGRLVDCLERKEGAEIRKFNCPFISMADGLGTLCQIDRLVMQKVIGIPPERVTNRFDGNPCCTFFFDLKPSATDFPEETESV